jgi:hypothetical protein
MSFRPKPRSKRHAEILDKMQAELDEINKNQPPGIKYDSPPGTNPKTWWGEARGLAARRKDQQEDK